MVSRWAVLGLLLVVCGNASGSGVVVLDDADRLVVLLEQEVAAAAGDNPKEALVPGKASQVHHLILTMLKKAGVKMSARELDQFESVESKQGAADIAKAEVAKRDVPSLLAMAKKLAKAGKLDTSDATKAYHKILTRLAAKISNMSKDDKASWVASSAVSLASKEGSVDFKSAIQVAAMTHMKKRAAELTSKTDSKKLALQKAEKDEAKERVNKDKLANDAKRAGASSEAAAEDQKKLQSAKGKAKEASRAYSAAWVKAKETDAEKRKLKGQAANCLVKQAEMLKNLQQAQAHLTKVTSSISTLSSSLSNAESGNDSTKVKSLKAKLKTAEKDREAAKAAVAQAEALHKNRQRECEQKASMAESMKVAAKKEEKKVEAAKSKRNLEVNKVKSAAKEAKNAQETAKNEKKGFEKAAAKASVMPQSIKVLSATQYCAVKQDAKSKEWKKMQVGFRGTSAELGNKNKQASDSCNGKKNCKIVIPSDNPSGCPSSGYLVRYRCVADDSMLDLLELGETEQRSLDSAIRKLSAKVAAEGRPVPKKASVEALKAKLSAISSSASQKGIKEATMVPDAKDRTVQLACGAPKVPKAIKAAVEKMDKAQKLVEKDDRKVAKAVESTEKKLDNKVAEAQKKSAKAQKNLKEQEELAFNAQKAVEDLQSKLSSLKDKHQKAKGKAKSELEGQIKIFTEKLSQANAAVIKAKVKAKDSKVEAKEAAQTKKVADNAARGMKNSGKATSSPKVNTAKKELKQDQKAVENAVKDVDGLKAKIASSADKTEVLRLSAQLAVALKAKEVAKEKEEEGKVELKNAKSKAVDRTSEEQRKKMEKAQDQVANEKAKLQALEVQQNAARNSQSKAELKNEVVNAKKTVKKLEKKEEKEAQKEQDSEKAKADQEKNDAEKKVVKSKETLKEDQKKLARAKELVKRAASATQVLKEATRISRLAGSIKEAKAQVKKAEKKEAKVLGKQANAGSGKDQKIMTDMKAEEARLEKEKEAKVRQLKETKRPEDVQRLQKEIKALEAKHKQVMEGIAAEKAKVKRESKAAQIGKKVTQKPKAKFASNPTVEKARAERATAEAEEQAAEKEVKQATQRKTTEAKERIEASVASKKKALEREKAKERKMATQMEVMQGQAKQTDSENKKLAILKQNILKGRPYHHGFTSLKDKLAALPPLKPRSAKAEAAMLSLLKETQPASAVCPKGKSCCVTAFADAGCRLQAGEFCSSGTNSAAGSWRTLLQAKLSIAGAKSVSLEVRWVKDKSQSVDNEGEVLRLRACGKFAASGAGCYPKEGAGFRFGSYFNTPAGQCVMSQDIAKVSGYKLKSALANMVAETKSQNSAEGKADAARQKEDKESARADALAKAMAKPKDEEALALTDLVLELLEADEQDDMWSVPDLVSAKGSFQLTIKDGK